MVHLENLRDLFKSDLKYFYTVEKLIVETLPKLIKAASSSEVQNAFREHLEKARGHVKRTKEIFDMLGVGSRGRRAKGIEGLMQEGKELISKSKVMDPDVLDAALIATVQRVDHYNMAACGTLRSYAQTLKYDKAVRLFQQTLDEKYRLDKKLTRIAEKKVNNQAARPD